MAGSSSHHIIKICVFSESSLRKDKEFLESANHLCRVLAERKIHLVYRGGSLGLMGCVSMRGVLKALAKGDIIGKIIREEL